MDGKRKHFKLDESYPVASIAEQTQATNSRFEKSLENLTPMFLQLIMNAPNQEMEVSEASEKLNVVKRRVYDITTVLEAVGIIEKVSRNKFRFNRTSVPTDEKVKLPNLIDILNQDMNSSLESSLNECINFMNEFAASKEKLFVSKSRKRERCSLDQLDDASSDCTDIDDDSTVLNLFPITDVFQLTGMNSQKKCTSISTCNSNSISLKIVNENEQNESIKVNVLHKCDLVSPTLVGKTTTHFQLKAETSTATIVPIIDNKRELIHLPKTVNPFEAESKEVIDRGQKSFSNLNEYLALFFNNITNRDNR